MTYAFDAARIRELLNELDQRLRAEGVAASVYVVGGAAISLQIPHSGRRTQDIDGITTDERLVEIVAQMADEQGLPEGWLNGSARPFLPALPPGALAPPESPGLRVVLATLEQLLAMKLVAGRARDHADIVALADALGIGPEQAVALTVDAYGAEALNTLTSEDDVTVDARALIRDPREG